jgi:CRISPR-associated protein Cas1
MTQAVLAEAAAANAMLVVCDPKHLPIGMLLPLVTHGRQTARFLIQASASAPLRSRLWSAIVQSKIVAQAAALISLRGADSGLLMMSKRVAVRNATALESHASRLYWPLVFADPGFRRSDDEDPRNSLLNYGYAVVRAVVARALCAAGLHPGISLHHHNQYDPFPLANDLLEPFRPLVDEWAASWCSSHQPPWILDRLSKTSLLARLSGRFSDGSEARSLFDWSALAAEALTRCLEKKQRTLAIPVLSYVVKEDQVESHSRNTK